jgi:transcription initiation factor TFIIIB Brf1 subunit/transcription initiation factor TFIIB
MGEISALQKFNCPACGAGAVWEPAQQAVVCPYCGTVSPSELSEDGKNVREHDLARGLRTAREAAGTWENDRTSVQCRSCKAIMLFDQEKVAQCCEFCGSPAIVPYSETRSPFRPESVLPFKVPESNVRESMREWYSSRWIAPNRLGVAALTDTVRGVYLPYWTFDKHANAEWTAESGYYYYVDRTIRDSNGRSRTIRERRTRWEYSGGSLQHFFDDELVSATRGVHPALLRKIEPFPTRDLVPYDPRFVSGWVVEQYQIDLIAAAQRATESIERKLRSLCAARVPGDTHRNLQVHANYSGETFKHVLVPVWLLTYTYGSKNFQVIMNGNTGQIAGDYPYSWVKISFAVLAGLIVLLILLYYLQA